jgi:hypothetical protein
MIQKAGTNNSRRYHLGQPSVRKKPEKKRKRSLLIALLLITPLVLLLLLACLVVEREPLIVETQVPTVDSAQRAKNLARNVLDTLNSQQERAAITASEDDLNALMTLVGRGEQRFAGRVRVTPGIMFVRASLRVPANPLGRYLNLRGELLPDERGLNINLVKIGKLGFPRALSTALLKGLLNLGLGNSEGSALMGSVQSLALTRDTVTLNLRSVPQLKERLKRLQGSLARLRDLSQGGEAPWDSSLVALYYGRLLQTGQNFQALPPPSLASYLGHLFRLARERSATEDPVKENSAALLALAIYLGDPRFDKLAGLNLKPDLLGRTGRGCTWGDGRTCASILSSQRASSSSPTRGSAPPSVNSRNCWMPEGEVAVSALWTWPPTAQVSASPRQSLIPMGEPVACSSFWPEIQRNCSFSPSPPTCRRTCPRSILNNVMAGSTT